MDSWRIRIRQGPVRALIAVCLLAGVFAMHGLTGSHDAAMALIHQPPTAAIRSAPTVPVAPAGHGAHAIAVPATDLGVSPAVHVQAGSEVIVRAGHDGHLHAMGDVCLAMLAALMLALVVALALRSLTVAHPVVLAAAAIRVATDGPSPPWRRRTLSKLCVLRT
ncbi:DUF6153 family protein [Kribbella catacumbae]|uniref:DUF6153 family protein n=1 Tax=Kribbella catacumbae TaxID=460086 RepID=UPI000476158C|nr:DUF6153 family protein [Kribbella catacumbae]